MSDGSIETQVVGAIRFALEAAANEGTALEIVNWLVNQAPATPPADTGSVRLFIEAIGALKGTVAVNQVSA